MEFVPQLDVPIQGSRGDRARAKLIDAALTCFSRDGFEGASIRDIARLAGQNTANVSYHFQSKEGLYHAVLSETMRRLREPAGEILKELSRLEANGKLTPEVAIELLQQFFGTVIRALIADDNGVRIAPLIVREQTRPTPTFDLLYENGIRGIHELLTRLVGVATGVSAEEPRTILRAHYLLGQFKSLITDRETLLRRMGWTDLKGENADAVVAIGNENIEIFLRAFHDLEKKRLETNR